MDSTDPVFKIEAHKSKRSGLWIARAFGGQVNAWATGATEDRARSRVADNIKRLLMKREQRSHELWMAGNRGPDDVQFLSLVKHDNGGI